MTDTTQNLDLREQIARIDRSQAETRKFAEEAFKLSAEARKLNREAMVAPFTAGAAVAGVVVGAVVAFQKLFGL